MPIWVPVTLPTVYSVDYSMTLNLCHHPLRTQLHTYTRRLFSGVTFLFCLEKPWHVTSVSDLYAQKLMQMNGEELIACNKQCLIRVYPNCSRVDSSNYNPQEMWNYGCQIGENIRALMP